MATRYENLANFASCSAYKCRLFDLKQSHGEWREALPCLDGRTRTRHHWLRTSSSSVHGATKQIRSSTLAALGVD
jgi:hypothetical protein